MKKTGSLFALAFAALIFNLELKAAIRTVSNNPQYPAAFTTISAALTASSGGDTILVTGSSTIYDANLNIAKHIVIIGPGFLLDSNLGLNENTFAATIGNNPIFSTGSSGSVIIGMRFTNIFTINAGVSNVSIIRCMTGGGLGAPFAGQINIGKKCNTILIQQCFMATRISMADSCDNLIYRNNLSYEIIFAPASTTNMIFDHNLIGGTIGLSVRNAKITNNIYSNTASIANVGSNVFQNNIFTGTQIPLGTPSSNQFNVSFASIAVGDSAASTDGYYRLKPGSPAVGAGTDGSDIGPFGGETPYNLSGVPLGEFDNTATLNGTSDYIQVPDRPELRPSQLTLETRLNLNRFQPDSIIGVVIKRVGQRTNIANWQLELVGKNIRFSFFDGADWHNVDTNNEPIASTNEWYFVSATYDSGTVRIFVNGNLLMTQTGLPPLRTDYTGDVQIGRGFDGYLEGKLDEVRIWNKARSQSEIQSSFQSTLKGNDSGLVAYYTFNENRVNGEGRPVLNRSISPATTANAARLNGITVGTATTPIFVSPTPPLSVNSPSQLPQSFLLLQNYPNPFNPTTTIAYHLPISSNVQLEVFDVLGRKVAMLVQERQSAGSYQVGFNASAISSGVYFYRLEALSPNGSFSQTRKMLFVK